MAIISGNLPGKFKTKRILEEGNRILQKESEKLTKLEQRILNSIEWIGEGIDTNEFYLKIVKCVIGLETLFKLKIGEQQKEFIECIAKLFENPSKNNEKVRKDAKNLYVLRSKIVHGGKRNLREEEAETAERLASGSLLTVLDNLNKFSGEKGEKDFYTWLKVKERTDN